MVFLHDFLTQHIPYFSLSFFSLQLTNEKAYGLAPGVIGTNDEAVEAYEVITGLTDSPQCRAAYVAAQLASYPSGTQVTVLGVTATGSTSRRLDASEHDHRQLTVAGLRFRTIIRNPSSTAAAIRNAFNNAGSTIANALGRHLNRPAPSRTAGPVRTLATRTAVVGVPTFAPIAFPTLAPVVTAAPTSPYLTGYFVGNAYYAGTDTACSSAYGMSVYPLQVCQKSSATTSFMYVVNAGDPNFSIYQMRFANGNCAGTGTTDIQPFTKILCGCASTNGVAQCTAGNYYSATFPTVPGNLLIQT